MSRSPDHCSDTHACAPAPVLCGCRPGRFSRSHSVPLIAFFAATKTPPHSSAQTCSVLANRNRHLQLIWAPQARAEPVLQPIRQLGGGLRAPTPQQKRGSSYLRRFGNSSASLSPPERHQSADKLVRSLPGDPTLAPVNSGRVSALIQPSAVLSVVRRRASSARTPREPEVGVKAGA